MSGPEGNTIKQRIYSLDVLRGAVMVLMALDHTRDFFHADAFVSDPLDPATTTPLLFFTRFITHYCAPVFIFLAGLSIFLQSLRKSREELSVFLFKRGLWLIFVECAIITFAWTFTASYPVFILQVIWAIGICMILMGVMVWLPYGAILALGLMIVFGHNILDTVDSTHQGLAWDLMRNGNFAFHPVGGGHQIVIIYPFVPWLGLMMVGYSFGKLYASSFDAMRRRKILTWTGIGLILLFVVLRYSNTYGNPFPWSVQHNPVATILSFLNVHKYPPSLLFMCITIGPALLFLTWFENIQNRLTKAISIYGCVPFFYYVLHFYIIHVLAMILYTTRGHSLSEHTEDVFGIPFKFVIAGEGYSLGIVYVIWILLVLALYPLCKWFCKYKKEKGSWWMSYL